MASERIVVVTGGAGYLGRCTAEVLAREGYRPVLLDNFSTGHRRHSDSYPTVEVDLSDLEATRLAFGKLPRIHAVIHFAAKAIVFESCLNPEDYFRNNLLATLNTAQCCVEKEISFFVHSSSCAVYGVPSRIPILEQTPFAPLSPYGETKAMAERMLFHFGARRGLSVLNLRYFNPAGALEGKIGESHEPETHLIPLVVRAALTHTPINIYGDQYPTPDGTCVRDFIHVEDLALAHVAALRTLEKGKDPAITALNLGTGKGSSVKEVIQAAEKVIGVSILQNRQPPRPGDPAELVADTQLAETVLNWKAIKSLEEMISDHYQWEKGRLK